MRSYRNSGVGRPTRTVALAASLIALAMVLAFPMMRARHFTQRFRGSQTLSQFQRHIFVGQPEKDIHEPIPFPPTTFAPLVSDVEAPDTSGPIAAYQIADRVPLPRLLLRLKLGSSQKSAQDPFL